MLGWQFRLPFIFFAVLTAIMAFYVFFYFGEISETAEEKKEREQEEKENNGRNSPIKRRTSASVTHTLTWIVCPMFCMVLNI